MAPLQERIKLGAMLLDRVVHDWYLRIIKPIEADESPNSVLGQLFGQHHIGLGIMSMTLAEEMDHGFRVGNVKQSEEMIRIWQAEIDHRLEEYFRPKQATVYRFPGVKVVDGRLVGV